MWPLPEGGVGAKVVVRRSGDEGGETRLLWLPRRWDSLEEGRREAIAAGMRLIDFQPGDGGGAWATQDRVRVVDSGE
jgi:hypothetical protein